MDYKVTLIIYGTKRQNKNMVASFVFLEEFLAVAVLYAATVAGIIWRNNKKIENKADKEQLDNIEEKVDKIYNATFGDEEVNDQGFVKDQENKLNELDAEIHEFKKELDKISTRNSAVLYILTKHLDEDEEEAVRRLLEDKDDYYDS